MQLVADVKSYLTEHVNEKVTLDELCKHFGVGQTALMQKFRLETNRTVIEYFNELKIAKAKVLLQNTSKSFTDISDELGFSSINYFSKLFRGNLHHLSVVCEKSVKLILHISQLCVHSS